MEKSYEFRKAAEAEIPQVFSLILQRMEWMNQKGIRQWNVSGYEKRYPQAYYEQKRQQGEVFVLTDHATNEIVAAAVLQESDERWQDDEPAVYVHNFATKTGTGGAGSAFLQFTEAYAIQKGKKYLRLDSPESNPRLAQYYKSQGFSPVGRCEQGTYRGILRQKELPR